MDRMVFQHDTVLSDVHMHRAGTQNLMTRLDRAGLPVFVSTFRILSERCEVDRGPCSETERGGGREDGDSGGEQNMVPSLDEDGDLDIKHRPRRTSLDGAGRDLVCPVILKHCSPGPGPEEETEDLPEDRWTKDVIRIEHTMATPLEAVGKQVWRGALLLADFILSRPEMFRGATVLELGAGTGLTSIVMATTAKTVYCTDVGWDLLNMCERNVSLNKHMMEPSGGQVRVRQLDWLQHSLCTDADVDFSWTEEEVADLHDNTSFIMAADVCYDDDLTDALFRTVYRLCSSLHHACTILFSVEKRINFSLRDLDVSCEAYNHFVHCLSQIQDMGDGRCTFAVEAVPSTFAQFLVYERVEQLELWKLTATPVHTPP